MKEFIRKLIGRLKERENHYRDEAKKVNKFPKIRICRELQKRSYSNAIKIVQELEKEYKMFREELQCNGWILCEKELPKEGKRYLVTAIWTDGDYKRESVYIAVYGKDGLWHSYNYEPVSYEVLAWQPLPAPYKENRE